MTGVLIWMARQSATTGQGIVTEKVVELFSRQNRGARVVQYRVGGSLLPLASVILVTLRLLSFLICRSRFGFIYAPPSRSVAGFLRDLPIFLFSRLRNIPLVLHVHGSELNLLFGRPWIGRIAVSCYSQADLIIFPSEHCVAPLKAFLPTTNIVCIENFNRMAEGGASLPKYRWAYDGLRPLNLLWNSNVMGTKGIGEVLEAISRINASSISVRLRVLGKILSDAEVGAAELQSTLESFAKNETTGIEFIGPTYGRKYREILEESDVILLPSYYPTECQPLAVIEAMTTGKALLLAATDALKATARDYPVFWVKPRDSRAIQIEIQRMLSEPEDKLVVSDEVVAATQKRFSEELFTRKILEIYKGYLGEIR